MNKIIAFVILGLTTITYANINAVVSILPQKTFLKKIGGDKVNISVMVKQGSSPHSYEPKPSQMRNINNADIYFSIGIDFEDTWLNKFKDLNTDMIVKDMGNEIEKISIVQHSHHKNKQSKNENHNHAHTGYKKDPHIWLSPINVKIIATNIYKELSQIDKKNKSYYKINLENFLEEITQTDIKIKQLLKNTPAHSKFMVFHPSWGYFARDYSLIQFAIESGGKSPKPKQIAYLIDAAKEEKVKALFTAPEFSTKTAKQIAKEVGVPVVKISPLSAQWSENLIGLAEAISGQ
jgi:zinc transport system substrate-binding protein